MLYIEKKKTPPHEMIRKVSKIKSSPEWKRIKNGNTDKIRNAFESLPKEIIRESLLEEQHYLCAYCMRRIQNNGLKTSIEHWYPLSKDREQALDYGNMLAVCDGGKKWAGEGKKFLCCDAYKADEAELTISPLNRQQMDKIVYEKDGFIKTDPPDEKMNEDMKNILRLNGIWKDGKFLADTSTELVKGRKDAYLRCKRFIAKLDHEGKCTSSRVKKKIDEIEAAEQRLEYAGVILYVLKRKYRSLVSRGL